MIYGNIQLSSAAATMNLKTDMCRICMMSSEYLKDVSFELTAEIVKTINSFANIDISMDISLPSIICNKCYTCLMDCINFKNLCIESNNTYQNFLIKTQNAPQVNKEKPPPNNGSVALPIKKEEAQTNNNESKNTIENIEFVNIKNLTGIEPSSELLNALGLIRKSENDVKPSSDDSMNTSVDRKNFINKNNSKKSYECTVCRMVLLDYGVYRRHLATHGESPYECKFCGIHFSKARSLKDHYINNHSGTRPYCCLQCPSKFVALNELTVHLRKHAGITDPYSCGICSKRFSTTKSLRIHNTIHENNKKSLNERYKKTANGFGEHCCSQCDRRFRKKCDLERHERVHSGEKPYCCKICNGRFQQAHNLTKHMVTHTGVRSFTCDICQKTFGRSDVLTRHMHVHEVSKPFSCEICFKTFGRQSQLTGHLRKRHSKNDETIN